MDRRNALKALGAVVLAPLAAIKVARPSEPDPHPVDVARDAYEEAGVDVDHAAFDEIKLRWPQPPDVEHRVYIKRLPGGEWVPDEGQGLETGKAYAFYVRYDGTRDT